MKKDKIILLLIVVVIGISVFIFRDFIFSKNIPESDLNNSEMFEKPVVEIEKANIKNIEIPGTKVPLDKISERITRKSFGDFITPQNSPVQPERFSGYHTGLDLETFENEADANVSIRAICDGEIISKRVAGGYGGLIVEKCILDDENMTVIYGHLDLKSVVAEVGDNIRKGDIVGNLGEGNSLETDGERKHLHLGIHKGNEINILGYVQNKSSLSDWMDPCLYITCNK